MITFFSTLGDQFFLNMQRRGNRLGTFGHHRRPSGRIGKRREASVNPWELSGTVGNLHFERFFTRFRHQIGQIWSYRGIHSTNRCEISRSFIWKGSRGLAFCKIYDFCQIFFHKSKAQDPFQMKDLEITHLLVLWIPLYDRI